MFTGIIQGTGKVKEFSKSASRSAVIMKVDLGAHSKGLKAGQSVSLNGACLTVTGMSKSVCTFEMIGETIKKTNLGSLDAGSMVNLERSMKAGDRIEGHFVLGHVDGVGTIKRIKSMPEEVQIIIDIPKKLSRYVVNKGSITIDGISLTVTAIKGTLVSASIIPHTINVTNLKTRKPGDRVNIETDILGKYILDKGR